MEGGRRGEVSGRGVVIAFVLASVACPGHAGCSGRSFLRLYHSHKTQGVVVWALVNWVSVAALERATIVTDTCNVPEPTTQSHRRHGCKPQHNTAHTRSDASATLTLCRSEDKTPRSRQGQWLLKARCHRSACRTHLRCV